MRRKERIPIFLSLIDGHLGDLLELVWKIFNDGDEKDVIVDSIYENMDNIELYWNDNPDLRFSQVLIGLGLIPNKPGVWFYMEEEEILDALDLNSAQIMFWGQRYDKDNNLLPEIIYKTIDSLETDHIIAILDGDWTRHPDYIKAFKEELSRRGIDYDNG